MTALCSGKICTIFPEKGALNFWKACTIALEYSLHLEKKSGLNTSHVLIHRALYAFVVVCLLFKYISCSYSSRSLCGLWEKWNWFKYISCSYSSRAEHKRKEIVIKFKYISCSYSSPGPFRMYRSEIRLNTSHVLIHPRFLRTFHLYSISYSLIFQLF